MFKKKNNGQISFVFVFFLSGIFIILLSAIFGLMMALFNTEFYKAGENIILQTNESLQDIQDPTIKANVQGMINSAQAASVNNIEVGTDLYRYGWVLLLVLTAVIIYLSARQNIEVGRIGGGGFV